MLFPVTFREKQSEEPLKGVKVTETITIENLLTQNLTATWKPAFEPNRIPKCFCHNPDHTRTHTILYFLRGIIWDTLV